MRNQFRGFVPISACGLALLMAGAALGRDDDVLVASAKILSAEGKQPARLQVTANVKSGWHTYSITQPPGGPIKTIIKVSASPKFEVGEFRALTPPVVHQDPAFDNMNVEEHSGTVVWEAPLTIAPDAGPLRITGAVRAQACKTSCIRPTDYEFEASTGPISTGPVSTGPVSTGPISTGPASDAPSSTAPVVASVQQPDSPAAVDAPPQGSMEYRSERSHLTLRGRLEPPVVAPGGRARIVLSAVPEPPFHAYALAESQASEIGRGKPTTIALRSTPRVSFGKPEPSAAPVSRPSSDAPMNVDRYYSGSVDFLIEAEVDAGASSGKYPIEGVISYQTCTLGKKDDAMCDVPTGARFRVVLEVAPAGAVVASDLAPTPPAPTPLAFVAANYNQSPLDARVPKEIIADAGRPKLRVIELNSSGTESSLIVILASSFLGGLILNLMPCVLPVIGLKLLSFVGQAGESRSRVLTLNLWYTAGLFAVFAVLATLAAGASLKLTDQNLGWGEQFASTRFNVSMCALVFVMALSFMGVWEIPVPGFVGAGKGTELAAQEGPAGAFFKGVMSTLLATPCSGPFLGSVFGFTLKQSPGVIYLVFGFIALGMASPYLLVGAFPSLIRWLPKPGAWMDTFKQAMGFTLMGAVVFMLSFLHPDYRIATLALLLGLGAACWWIGRTPLYEPLPKRLAAWAQGAAIAAVVGYFGFRTLVDHPSHPLPWKPFTAEAPAELAASGKTVMVDFTADWCATCKVNLKLAINTEAVKKLVEKNGVVPLLADWTDGSDEIKAALEKIPSQSIPVLAIYPAGRPDEVLVLRDLVTQGQVLNALERAGPSDDATPKARDEQRISSVQ